MPAAAASQSSSTPGMHRACPREGTLAMQLAHVFKLDKLSDTNSPNTLASSCAAAPPVADIVDLLAWALAHVEAFAPCGSYINLASLADAGSGGEVC